MRDFFENKNVLYISIGFFFLFFSIGGAQQYLIPLLKLQEKENLALTSLILLYTTTLIVNFFAPKIISSLGLKLSLLIGTLTFIFFPLILILNNALFFYLASIFVGFGAVLVWQSSALIITHVSEKNKIGQNLGFQFSMFLFGMSLGIAVGGFFLEKISLGLLYGLFSLAAVFSLPFFLKVINPKIDIPNERFKFNYIFNPKLLLLSPVVISSYFLSAQAFSGVNLIILNSWGITYVGILSTVFVIARIGGSFLSGRLADIYNRKYILYGSILIGVIGTLLITNSPIILWAGLGIVLISLSSSTAYPVCLSLLKIGISHRDYKYSLSAFHVYASFGVIFALLSTRFLEPKAGLESGLIVLFLSFITVFIFSKK